MSSFDILPLARHSPPVFLCMNCAGIWAYPEDGEDLYGPDPDGETSDCTKCYLCGCVFVQGGGVSLRQFCQRYGYYVPPEEYYDQAWALAGVVSLFEECGPCLHVLLEAISRARWFVHFTTYGISHQIIGALKLASHRVSVRGIVSCADESVEREVRIHSPDGGAYFGTMNPEFSIYTTPATNDARENSSIPHQKLVIVDGLLAFKGSANLTLSGWRKAAEGLDLIELVTDVDEVARLNNQFFSPLIGRIRRAVRIEIGDHASVFECVTCS